MISVAELEGARLSRGPQGLCGRGKDCLRRPRRYPSTMPESGESGGNKLQSHVDLAWAYAEMGLLDDALDELRIVFDHEPDHPMALACLEKIRREPEPA